MDTLQNIVSLVNEYLSDYVLIILLVGAGLFFTIRTRFVQIRCFGEGLKNTFGNFGSLIFVAADHRSSSSLNK